MITDREKKLLDIIAERTVQVEVALLQRDAVVATFQRYQKAVKVCFTQEQYDEVMAVFKNNGEVQ